MRARRRLPMVHSAWPVLAPDPQLPLRRACGQRNAALRVGDGGEVSGESAAERHPPGGLHAALCTTHGFESSVGGVGQQELPRAVPVQVSGAGGVEVATVDGVGEVLASARDDLELPVPAVQTVELDRSANVRGTDGGDLDLPFGAKGTGSDEVAPTLWLPHERPCSYEIPVRGIDRDPAALPLGGLRDGEQLLIALGGTKPQRC